MKKEEAKNNTENIIKELDLKRVALRDIRFGIAGSKSRNVKEQKKLKKEIARLETVLNSTK